MRVADLLNIESSTIPVFKSLFADEGSKELADRILLESPEIWDQIQSEVATLLKSRFSDDQLQELEEFLSSETGRAWTASGPEIFAAYQGTSNGPESFSFRFASIGCVIGIVGPNIEAAKQKAGVDSPGLTDDLYASLQPLKNASALTGDCILRKGSAKWPDLSIVQLQMTSDYRLFVQELIQNGDCPMPFPKPENAESDNQN